MLKGLKVKLAILNHSAHSLLAVHVVRTLNKNICCLCKALNGQKGKDTEELGLLQKHRSSQPATHTLLLLLLQAPKLKGRVIKHEMLVTFLFPRVNVNEKLVFCTTRNAS